MTREEIAAILARAQAEIERQDAANERAVCRTPGELAALRRAAATAYRVEQAEYLVRSLLVRIEVDGALPAETRAFVVVTPEGVGRDGRVYVRVRDALASPPWREEVLQRALAELQQWRDRYRHLKELADLLPVVDTVLGGRG